jgi:hypothetical protein
LGDVKLLSLTTKNHAKKLVSVRRQFILVRKQYGNYMYEMQEFRTRTFLICHVEVSNKKKTGM